MKTVIEITVVYGLSVLFHSLLCWALDFEYNQSDAVRGMVIWYAIQWIEYRRKITSESKEPKQ